MGAGEHRPTPPGHEPPALPIADTSPPHESRRRLRYPKRQRLRKRRDFLRIQEKSTRVGTRHFVLLLAPRPETVPAPQSGESGCRLGIVASKKVGGAVVRNRTKRLLREAFRRRPALFPPGVDLVVIAKPGAADLSFDAVCREIEDVSSLLTRRARDVRQSGPRDVRQSGPRNPPTLK